MKVFALYNLKGGVGKTTACINLAYCAAQEGHRTLLWDLDPQAAATFYIGGKEPFHPRPQRLLKKKKALWGKIQSTGYDHLSLLPGHLQNRELTALLGALKKPKRRIRRALKTVKDDYDYVFLDCPASLDLLSENIFRAAHYLLFPMLPTTLSELTLRRVYQFLDREDYDPRKIVPFFNLVDRRKKLHRHTIEVFRKRKWKALRTELPYSSKIEMMGIERAPLPHYAPDSDPAQAFFSLWQELKMMPKLMPKSRLRAGRL